MELITFIHFFQPYCHILGGQIPRTEPNENERNSTTQKFSNRPKFLKQIPNTFYRVVNVITSDAGKDLFNLTRTKQTRKQLDQTHPHKEIYESLQKLYNDSKMFNQLDESLLSQTEDVKLGINISDFVNCDKLNDWMELQHTTEYIVHNFRFVCNNKNTSGFHDPFAKYTKGKGK